MYTGRLPNTQLGSVDTRGLMLAAVTKPSRITRYEVQPLARANASVSA